MKKSVSLSHKHNKASSSEDGTEIKGNKKEKVKVSLWIFKGGLNIGEFETETSPKNKSGDGKKALEERQEAPPPRDDDDDIVVQSIVPSLGTMKKFASGRGTLSDSDVEVLCTNVTTNVTSSD